MAISKLNPIEGGIPKGNTSNRSVEFPSPAVGDVYYNGELEVLEIYNGTTWVAVSAPPAVPSIVSITDVGTGLAYTTGGTFTVVVAPGSGGSTPLQYNAVTSAGGFSASSGSTTLSLTGLTPDTSFVVAANAQNNFGTTVNSSPFSAVTATTLPQVPTIGTATASGSANEITVTWTNGVTGGKALTSITITPYLNGTTAETPRTAATTSSTSYTFTEGQLTAGAAYTFKVKATNANGTSAESSATNSATMPTFITVSYLVIAGGGGGGGAFARGAGGAGGYRSSVSGENSGRGASAESTLALSKSTNYTITVGAGGANGGGSDVGGSNGENSVFSTITSTGGGRGGGGSSGTHHGGNGGSGGGSNYGGTAGTGTTGQGYDGGVGSTNGNTYGGGGGGGAGAAGTNGAGGVGGNGGNGVASSITGSSVTRAGGGAGGRYDSGTAGTAGTGGGGAIGTNGTANTGGGGGGCNISTPGGNGGKGVVIIRWLTSSGSITVGAGLTADSTGTDGSYSYKRFTDGSGNVSFA